MKTICFQGSIFLFAVNVALSQVQNPTVVNGESGYGSPSNAHYALQIALTNSKTSVTDMYRDNGSPSPFIALNEDSALHSDSTNNKSGSVAWRVAGETALGGVTGVIIAIPGALIGRGLSSNKGDIILAGAVVGAYIGYTLGSSLGVYIARNGQKENVSFLGTLAGGIVGAGVGIGVSQLSNQKGVGSLAPFILPIAASVIYVELID